MIFKRMREHILGKAIRGKLVPQLHEEGNVKQIGNAPTNVPFAIPSTWRWCSLGNLVDYGKAEKISCNDIPSSTWVLELEDIEENTGKILEKKRDVEVKSNKNVFEEGYLLYSKLRPYLNKVVIADECGVCTTELIPINVKSAKAPLLAKYLQFFLMSPDFVDYANRHSHGTKPRLGTNDAKAANIPIPPFEEQNRIVAKIESLFGEIDRAEKAYEELQSLANVLRGQILQKAIQGKLVPQLPEDGVVEQIGHAPEEMPFELPASWKWASLNSIGTIVSGATPKTSVAEFWNGDINWVTPADLGKSSSKWISHGSRFLTKAGLKSCSAVLMPKGSIVYSSRAPIGHIAIAANELCTNQGCKSFVPKEEYILTEWAYYTLIARTKDIQSRASGTTFKEISGTGMGNTLIPLPPLAEQKRIVAKVEALFEQIDLMTKQIVLGTTRWRGPAQSQALNVVQAFSAAG